jgi:hypothetical protein
LDDRALHINPSLFASYLSGAAMRIYKNGKKMTVC